MTLAGNFVAAGRNRRASVLDGDPRPHLEFTVGVADQSHDLDHELQYANTILKGCQTYAAPLAEQGWTADDTMALSDAITTLEGDPSVRDTAGNALYRMCLTVQNAARLAYPVTQTGKVADVIEASARFLLDQFPPRGSTSAEPTPPPAPQAK